MAVTKIIPIRSTIQKSVDYICNPDKTDGSLLIHTEDCFQQTAGLTFHHHLAQCRAGGNTIGRHLIQSFAPGEVDPDTAHEIGKKLASEILGGEYAFVMATHVDRGHVHNHFIWGAANTKTHKRYRSNKGTYHEIRKISDRLCEEHSLSVIVPHGMGKSYTEYNAERKGTSWKAKLKNAITTTASESVDFEDFIKRMESQGYAVKRGKHISFQAPEQTRFTRSKTLGADFTEEAIREKISQKANSVKGSRETLPPLLITPTPQTTPPEKAVQRIIDINNSDKIKGSPSYEQWARIHNIKVMADTLIFIQEHGGIDEFNNHFKECISDKHTLSQALRAVDERVEKLTTQISDIALLRKHIKAYTRTKDVHKKYREMKKSPNSISFFGKDRAEEFRKEHKADISAYEAAKKVLDKAKQPLPTVKIIGQRIKAIENEIDSLKRSKPETRQIYEEKNAELNNLERIRKNAYDMLPRNKERTKSHDISR